MWPVCHRVLSGPAGVLGEQLVCCVPERECCWTRTADLWPLVPLRAQLAKVQVDSLCDYGGQSGSAQSLCVIYSSQSQVACLRVSHFVIMMGL